MHYNLIESLKIQQKFTIVTRPNSLPNYSSFSIPFREILNIFYTKSPTRLQRPKLKSLSTKENSRCCLKAYHALPNEWVSLKASKNKYVHAFHLLNSELIPSRR